MVRVGEYELRLVRPGGSAPFPEVAGPDGKAYTVAEPGAAFEVQVTRHPAQHKVPAPAVADTFHNVRLFIDGQCVGISKDLAAPATTTFEGFLKAGDGCGATYQGFVFSKPKETEAKQATGTNFDEGSITCEVSLARFTGALMPQHHRSFGPAATNESVAKLPEGKKFFLAPSLTTGRGELKQGRALSSRACELAGPRGGIAELRLRYETAATLLLRGVLKRENAVDRAILQQFPDTADEQDENGGAGPSQRRGRAVAPAGAGGRKRQRAAAEQEQEELIDLTNVADPRDEVLAAKRANKVLECDLTADDDDEGGGGAWRAVKQEALTVL